MGQGTPSSYSHTRELRVSVVELVFDCGGNVQRHEPEKDPAAD